MNRPAIIALSAIEIACARRRTRATEPTAPPDGLGDEAAECETGFAGAVLSQRALVQPA